MYDSTTTVAVGLDVHARSIRLAAVRADELLEEWTLPYDEEAVERAVRRWPGVRCCYDARPAPALEVLSAPRADAADQLLDCRAAQVAFRAAVRVRSSAADLRHLCARGRPGRRADRAAGARDPRDGRAGAVACAGRAAAFACAGSTH